MDGANNGTPISVFAIPPPMRRGISILAQSHRYAKELDRSHWDFAVEIQTLRNAGISNSDLRWLVCRALVEHALEITPPGANGRSFQAEGDLSFGKRTCFVLSELGARVALELRCEILDTSTAITVAHSEAGRGRTTRPTTGSNFNGSPNGFAGVTTENHGHSASNGDNGKRSREPHWDCERNELRFDDQLVKEFKLPSPNQQTILAAFEEEGWPPRIDDPLPPTPDTHPKRRLHDTINSLNRNHKNSLIHFMGDGTGTGIRWEIVR